MNVHGVAPVLSIPLLALIGCGDPGLVDEPTKVGETPPVVVPGGFVEQEHEPDEENCEPIEDSSFESEGGGPNLLQSVHRGGAAKVVEITATVSGEVAMDLVYSRDLEADCDAIHEPQAALCDLTGSADLSERTNRYGGPSWGNYGDDVRGVLVIDACNDGSCDTVDFNEVRVFQAYLYAKVTHLHFYVHSELGDVAPSWDDGGWTLLIDDAPVGAGKDVHGDTESVAEPTVIDVTPHAARYVRVDVSNDGSHEGDARSIDLRSIKLFCAP
jgi:hypothetical protein